MSTIPDSEAALKADGPASAAKDPRSGGPVAVLDSDAALQVGVEALVRLDPVMARLVREGAMPHLRRRSAGFEGLAWIVVGQQVSTASASAIWGRVKERFPVLSPASLLGASDEDLRGVGLSRPKVRTLRAAAEAVQGGALPLEHLGDLSADEAHRLMVAVSGIGPWTADVYLLFCLGHADAFPGGDLALQEAARLAYDLEARPSSRELAVLAEAWRPWRGVAAKVLWAFYRIAKAREGAPLGG
jgi:DNA-3-methyladenine glycosylase II